MFTGSLVADLLLGDVRSLKEKRSVVRPVVAELRRRYAVAAAEVGDADLHRRTQVGVAAVAADAAHVTDVLDACERLLADRPEVTLLSRTGSCSATPTTGPRRPPPTLASGALREAASRSEEFRWPTRPVRGDSRCASARSSPPRWRCR